MKNQNWIPLVLITLILGVGAAATAGCKKSEHENGAGHAHQYTCPHHPEVVQNKPGNCPKCGMKLVEKH